MKTALNALLPLALAAFACLVQGGEMDVQDLLPADAIVAVCWYGDSADLQKTAMYQLLEEPEVKQWLESLRQTIAGANQLAATFLRVNLAQLKPLLGCRIGLAVTPAAGNRLGPPVDVLIVAKVGDAQADPRQKVAGLLAQLGALMPGAAQQLEVAGIAATRLGAGPVGGLVYAFRGDYLLASTSQGGLEAALKGERPTLRGVAGFRRANELAGSPVALLLYNHTAVLEQFIGMAPPEVQNAFRELGLNEISTVGVRLGARDRALVTTVFAQTVGERRGLLKVVASDPVDRELAKLIPRDASIASVSNLDPGALYDTIVAVAQVVGEPQHVDVRQQIAGFEARAGVSLRNDLFDALGRGTVVTTSGESVLPAVIVSQAVADGPKVEKALEALVKQLDAVIKEGRGPEAGAALKSVTFGKHTLRYLVTPGVPVPVAPCYAMVGGRIVWALSPIHLKDYLAFLDGAEPCLLENPGFMALEKLVPKDAVTFSYSDFGEGFVSAYRVVGPMLTMAHGIPRNPVAIDLANLPATRTIRKHMFGCVSYTYATKDMVVWECHSPLGVGLMGPVPALAAAGVGAGMLLPAINTARTRARETVSMNNLKQLGMACMVFANDHEQALPANLGVLFDNKVLDGPQILVAPNDPAPEQVGDRPSSYRYLLDEQPGVKLKIGDVNRPEQLPLAWERQSFGRGRRNVLFVDGHVESMTEADFQPRLARVRGWLKKKADEQKGEF